MMRRKLCFISCTKEKVWDSYPQIGGVEAGCAYTHPSFLLASRIAQKLEARVIIFSAKYGLLDPWDKITETYDVTFSRENDPCVSERELLRQADEKGLWSFQDVYLFCNAHYHQRIVHLYRELNVKIHNPLLGCESMEEECYRLNGYCAGL